MRNRFYAAAVTGLLSSLTAHAIDGGRLVAAGDPLALSVVKVILEIDGEPDYCSGVVVSPPQILTATHCTHGKVLEIRVGPATAEFTSKVSKVTPMPKSTGDCTPTEDGYDACVESDLAVLDLANPLPKSYPPLPIGGAISIGDTISIAGFGELLLPDETIDKQLRQVDQLKIADRAGGFLMYSDPTGRGASFGDSGGPWLHPDADGKWTIVGIVSKNGGTAPRTGSSADLAAEASLKF